MLFLIRCTASIPNGEERHRQGMGGAPVAEVPDARLLDRRSRSEEHTSELQSLMSISYAVCCLKQKKRSVHKTMTLTVNMQSTNTDIDLETNDTNKRQMIQQLKKPTTELQ